MLEAPHFDAVSIVFPSILAIVDECSCLAKTAESTKAFTTYIDIVLLLYGKHMDPGWSGKELNFFKTKSSSLKRLYASHLALISHHKRDK